MGPEPVIAEALEVLLDEGDGSGHQTVSEVVH